MKFRRFPKFRSSLLSRYFLIVLAALLFVPVVIPLSFLATWLMNSVVTTSQEKANPNYINSGYLTANWHDAAKQLADASPDKINQRLKEYKKKYPFATIFWVDHSGETHQLPPVLRKLPVQWSLEDTIQYMKKGGSDDNFFTVVAFIGDSPNKRQGFMGIEVPRSYFVRGANDSSSFSLFGITLLLLFAFFAGLSYLFFRDIRKRLLTLESAMHFPGEDGLPQKIHTGKADEIGMLEQSFNYMVDQLRESRIREVEEEHLRKRLVSNLSHDLRTPLTVIGSHLYSLKKENLSEQGSQSLTLMQDKMRDLDHLIDHLLSYNLLTSGKYAIHPKSQDILRIVRESAAAWYPLWEREGLEPDIDLDGESLIWPVDEQAFRRVLDNLFQNIVRHAKSGRYIGLSIECSPGRPAELVIHDRGPGMLAESGTKGAGLGLAIVKLLLKEMSLKLDIDSTTEGTRMRIHP
ncbi:HAMP domain-containing sensor histidine kinase [Paenibacillus sp. J22TS3]|uniref:HAMP domain-containing sensor histidine kinase n=1 Tax=Paenibacillus sp. J22TS3 TaxID=2807192 RepID=UPI001B15C515|nr:HAMP domain-containing sensor histidine kinase [Paenibacillus sp. J22TS3]GIP24554.1 two-component sensor histidine kinase [Paenibacillus sp. J22TS3]